MSIKKNHLLIIIIVLGGILYLTPGAETSILGAILIFFIIFGEAIAIFINRSIKKHP